MTSKPTNVASMNTNSIDQRSSSAIAPGSLARGRTIVRLYGKPEAPDFSLVSSVASEL